MCTSEFFVGLKRGSQLCEGGGGGNTKKRNTTILDFLLTLSHRRSTEQLGDVRSPAGTYVSEENEVALREERRLFSVSLKKLNLVPSWSGSDGDVR